LSSGSISKASGKVLYVMTLCGSTNAYGISRRQLLERYT